jgi:hypothetical protein
MSNGTTPRKNALMLQATSALTRGAGAAELTEDAFAWFHSHYYDWIDKPKASGRSPQDVWGEQWADFARRFGEIGRRAAAAAGNGRIEAKTLETSALAVEAESDCPWCPDKA